LAESPLSPEETECTCVPKPVEGTNIEIHAAECAKSRALWLPREASGEAAAE
jgi:hypothetical protein